MTKEFIEVGQFEYLLKSQSPIIDVRAPIEFASGHIPGAINLPLLTNEERHLVGTTYKEKGQEAAIELGYSLVSGEVKKQRVSAWCAFVKDHPSAVVTCFRGGLRSKISQSWLSEAGFDLPRVQGGYKAFRQFLLSELQRLSARPMVIVSGATGSGKTLLISEIKKVRPTVHLEFLAKHRGSAFGAYEEAQPAQADFENHLAAELLRGESPLPLVVEDESRMIGKCIQPEIFFKQLRQSPLVLIDEPLLQRVEIIFTEYILNASSGRVAFYEKAIHTLAKKLGGLRYQELLFDFKAAQKQAEAHHDFSFHKIWITKMLEWYYDPLYARSLKKRDPKIIFRGSRAEVLSFLKNDSQSHR